MYWSSIQGGNSCFSDPRGPTVGARSSPPTSAAAKIGFGIARPVELVFDDIDDHRLRRRLLRLLLVVLHAGEVRLRTGHAALDDSQNARCVLVEHENLPYKGKCHPVLELAEDNQRARLRNDRDLEGLVRVSSTNLYQGIATLTLTVEIFGSSSANTSKVHDSGISNTTPSAFELSNDAPF